MTRPAVVVALPPSESATVCAELEEAGFVVLPIEQPRELERLLEMRKDIGLAVLDGEIEEDVWRVYELVLRDAIRPIPALTVVSPRAFERLTMAVETGKDDEYFTRPYSADSIRWRVEAMCIRRETVDDGSGPILQAGGSGVNGWNGRATTIAVFNPKGGVGKTTVATNLASALQMRKGKTVLLIDADTVTGHVTTSLGIDAVRTVADSWRDEAEGGPAETLLEIASAHASGMKVVALTDSPLHTDVLDPARLDGRDHRRAGRCRRRRHRPASLVQHAQPGDLRRGRQDPRPGHARRARHPGRGPAARRGGRPGLPRTPGDGHQPGQQRRHRRGHGAHGRHAGPRPHPLGRPALRARRQRGPDRHRDVPEGKDHEPTSTSSPTGCSGAPKLGPSVRNGFRFAVRKEPVRA